MVLTLLKSLNLGSPETLCCEVCKKKSMTNHILQYSVAHSKYSGSKKGQGNGKEGLHHNKPAMQRDKHSTLCLHVLQLGWRCHNMSNYGLGQPHPDSRAICSPHVLLLECLHSLSLVCSFSWQPFSVPGTSTAA